MQTLIAASLLTASLAKAGRSTWSPIAWKAKPFRRFLHRENREIAEFSDAELTALLKERITMAHHRHKDGAAGFCFILPVTALTVLLGLAWLELDRRTNINIKHRFDVMQQRSAAAPRPPEGHPP